MTDVKPPLVWKKTVTRHSSHSQCWHLQLFYEKMLTIQQNQLYEIDEGAHGEHFQPKSHIKN